MPDLADLAQIQQERLDVHMRKARQPAVPVATGYCLNCGEPLPDDRRWCSVECRNDWQRMDAALRRQGL
jgi:RNA polymerase-binding transcription factor DksA